MIEVVWSSYHLAWSNLTGDIAKNGPLRWPVPREGVELVEYRQACWGNIFSNIVYLNTHVI